MAPSCAYNPQVEPDTVSNITVNAAYRPELRGVFGRFVRKREPLHSTSFSGVADTGRDATFHEMPHLDRLPLRAGRSRPGRDSCELRELA